MLKIHLCLLASLVITAGCSSPPPAEEPAGEPPDEAPAAGLHPLEAYEGGSKQAEDRLIGALAQFFGRPVAPGEPLLRGTHAIGTCTRADFEIDDLEPKADLPDDLAVGVFAEPGIHDARVRFS